MTDHWSDDISDHRVSRVLSLAVHGDPDRSCVVVPEAGGVRLSIMTGDSCDAQVELTSSQAQRIADALAGG